MESKSREQLQKEIETLESKENISDDELQKIEVLKTELAKIELVGGEAELTASSDAVKYRPLAEVELRKLREFTSRYPGFSSLSGEGKLDRVCLILTQGFGFGSFNLALIQQAARAIAVELPENFEVYLKEAVDPITMQNKFIDVGGSSFKVNRLFAQNLLDGKNQQSEKNEEPIRKKVVETRPASVPSAQPARVLKAEVKPKAVTPQVAPVEDGQKKTSQPIDQSKKINKQIIVVLAVAVGVLAVYFLTK